MLPRWVAILLLVPASILATMLGLRSTAMLCVLVATCANLMAFFHLDLPWKGEAFHLPRLYMIGLWAAIVIGTLFLAAYAWRVAAEARRMAAALSATRLALDHEQRIAELGALAAAAAHGLVTPLGTIAMVAKEFERDLEPESPLVDDVALLISQSARCREILAWLSKSGATDHNLPVQNLPIKDYIDMIAGPYRSERIDAVVDAAPEDTMPTSPEPTVLIRFEINHGLGKLIENAA